MMTWNVRTDSVKVRRGSEAKVVGVDHKDVPWDTLTVDTEVRSHRVSNER